MLLILLRHGTAEPWQPNGEDAKRALIDRGTAEAARAGKFARKMGWRPGMVLTSPLVRARQTATLFCDTGGYDAPVVEPFLASGMHPEHGTAHLTDYQHFETVVIVGHEPDFSSLIAFLTGSPAMQIKVGKGSLWGVECNRLAEGRGIIRFGLPAKVLKRMV